MTLDVPRLPFALDPLIAEAKRRMRRRRVLVVTLAVALIAGASGAAVALRGPGGSGQGLATARVPGQFSFRYPVGWKRVSWSCSHFVTPVLLLTTANPTPTCGPRFPAREQLGLNGVAVWLANDPSQPTVQLAVEPGLQAREWVTCTGRAAPGRPFSARIHNPGLLIGAVVCGPDYARGEAAIRRMLASIGG